MQKKIITELIKQSLLFKASNNTSVFKKCQLWKKSSPF